MWGARLLRGQSAAGSLCVARLGLSAGRMRLQAGRAGSMEPPCRPVFPGGEKWLVPISESRGRMAFSPGR